MDAVCGGCDEVSRAGTASWLGRKNGASSEGEAECDRGGGLAGLRPVLVLDDRRSTLVDSDRGRAELRRPFSEKSGGGEQLPFFVDDMAGDRKGVG